MIDRANGPRLDERDCFGTGPARERAEDPKTAALFRKRHAGGARRNDPADPLDPKKIAFDPGKPHVHLAAQITAQLRQIGFGRDPAGHSGPHGLGDRLGLIGVKAPLALSWRVTARVSNAASTMSGR